MNETITLPVAYQGSSIEVPLTIVPRGYTYQLLAELDGKKLIFEKDDDGQFRVIDVSGDFTKNDRNLAEAILKTLQSL